MDAQNAKKAAHNLEMIETFARHAAASLKIGDAANFARWIEVLGYSFEDLLKAIKADPEAAETVSFPHAETEGGPGQEEIQEAMAALKRLIAAAKNKPGQIARPL